MRRLISFLVIAAVLTAAAFFMATHPQAYTVLRGDRALEPTRARDLENGKTLFTASGCASCHAASDDGFYNTKRSYSSLDEKTPD